MEKVNAFAQKRSSAGTDKEKSAGREFADKAAEGAGRVQAARRACTRR